MNRKINQNSRKIEENLDKNNKKLKEKNYN